jgi:hypothetical protein
MSIASKITGALSATKDKQPETNAAAVDAVRDAENILARLESETAEHAAEIETLKRRLGQLALEANGATSDQVNAAEAELEAKTRGLSKLRYARAAAVEKLRAARADQVRVANAGYLRTAKRLAKQRDEAAAGLSNAISELVKHWTAIHAANRKLAMSFPGSVPSGSLSDPNEVKRVVESELYRLASAATLRDAPSFPGARSPTLDMIALPAGLPSLVSQIADANAYLIRTLEAGPLSKIAPAAIEEFAPTDDPTVVPAAPPLEVATIAAAPKAHATSIQYPKIKLA